MIPNCSKFRMFLSVFIVKSVTLLGYFMGKSFLPSSDKIQIALLGFMAGIFVIYIPKY